MQQTTQINKYIDANGSSMMFRTVKDELEELLLFSRIHVKSKIILFEPNFLLILNFYGLLSKKLIYFVQLESG